MLHKTKNTKNSRIFHERFLLNFKIIDSLNPKSKVRSETLNSPTDTTGYHQGRIDASEKEMQEPITEIITGTRKELIEFAKLPKKIFKDAASLFGKIITAPVAIVGNAATRLTAGTAKIATQVVANPLGLAANIPRYAADLARLVVRLPILITDYVGEFIGKPSAIIQSTRERALSAIDKGSAKVLTMGANIRNKVLSVIGADANAH